ncbi:hypothetical protein DN407_31380 (plasmid) [Bacillus sp. JAS24-2]|uniref:hypothetical protein n=1 Tax=Bacillus sp. JAS24-2 TaxID=2217832 RepID=UPI0011ED50C0|nr:hypothetical protein [Bacillus sp. JAS24-2]QEL82900.1 hypothetical protein DN407_31380 [Bacillus sp. JAS24-2]
MKDIVKLLKWVSGGLEALLGIPILGGIIVISLHWSPLVFMLALHIITLVLAKKNDMSANGNILGIVTSCLGWIPFVGMIMHILSAIFIMVGAARKE